MLSSLSPSSPFPGRIFGRCKANSYSNGYSNCNKSPKISERPVSLEQTLFYVVLTGLLKWLKRALLSKWDSNLLSAKNRWLKSRQRLKRGAFLFVFSPSVDSSKFDEIFHLRSSTTVWVSTGEEKGGTDVEQVFLAEWISRLFHATSPISVLFGSGVA